MELRVRHRTTYRYQSAVDMAQHMLHLSPRDTATQTVDQMRAQMAVIQSPVTTKVTGRPGVILRRPSRIHSSSISWSMVPRLTATPRISSISARVTGW